MRLDEEAERFVDVICGGDDGLDLQAAQDRVARHDCVGQRFEPYAPRLRIGDDTGVSDAPRARTRLGLPS